MGGRLKFRLSNMIPISWFYKLKHMNKHPYSSSSSSSYTSSSLIATNSTSSSTSSSTLSLSVPQHTHRTSQYFKRALTPPPTIKFQNSGQILDTQFVDSPRKCSRRRGRRSTRGNRVSSSPLPNSTSKKNTVTQTDDFKSLIFKDSIFGKTHDHELPPIVTKRKPRLKTKKESMTHDEKALILKDSIFGKTHDLELPPIVTKRKPRLKTEKEAKTHDEKALILKDSVFGKKPRLKTETTQDGTSSEQGKKKKKKGRRVLESTAVVKRSVNPEKDFMESMVEMIVENEIKGSKDLEDLLACYLQLNSDEYHELIINVFKQIWFSVAETRLKMK